MEVSFNLILNFTHDVINESIARKRILNVMIWLDKYQRLCLIAEFPINLIERFSMTTEKQTI